MSLHITVIQKPVAASKGIHATEMKQINTAEYLPKKLAFSSCSNYQLVGTRDVSRG
jgi:hypothetical protein